MQHQTIAPWHVSVLANVFARLIRLCVELKYCTITLNSSSIHTAKHINQQSKGITAYLKYMSLLVMHYGSWARWSSENYLYLYPVWLYYMIKHAENKPCAQQDFGLNPPNLLRRIFWKGFFDNPCETHTTAWGSKAYASISRSQKCLRAYLGKLNVNWQLLNSAKLYRGEKTGHESYF